MDNYTGKRLDGRYEIQEVIGVGGMAVVYKAYDNIDDRIVAVKILKDEYLANEEFRRRFKNESKAIAVLSHPNIVKVYDVSYGDRLQYIVMEHVEGITLKEYIEQQGRINWRETIHFMMQILRALQHAHDKGIVHRDIKPQNILLLQNGTIKVTDFGIARFARSETRTMQDSGAIGSVHYISPEQARGEATDDKADIYSVGVVLYEMLTGQLPFQSENSVSVALMQLQKDPVMPRELNSTIPPGLEQITMHAMEKNPKDRYQSAAEMLLDLEEIKRNPAIKFDYFSFVDDTPTKYVSEQIPPLTTSMPTDHYDIQSGDDYDYDSAAAVATRSKTTPILIGVACGLVVLIAIGALLYSIFGGTDDDMVRVPQLVGKNYQDVMADEEYSQLFHFKAVEAQSSGKAFGEIISTDPAVGEKVARNSTITLTYAGSSSNSGDPVRLPNVAGKDYVTAQEELALLGLKTALTAQQTTSETEGIVLRTDPAANRMVEAGSTVTIVYATQKDMPEVPNLVGWQQSDVADSLKLLNLTLGKVEYVNSNRKKGEVVSQSISERTKVPIGTEINIEVSNGIPAESTGVITMKRPSYGSGNGTMQIFVNGTQYGDTQRIILDGANMDIPISGSGGAKDILVKINDQVYFTCKLDFSSNPAKVSSQNYDGNFNLNGGGTDPGTETQVSDAVIPNVTKETQEAAEAALKERGFNNVTINTREVTRNQDVGIVLEQDPPYALFERRPLDTPITLVVGVRAVEDE